MNREESISEHIKKLSGEKFEDFAYGLLNRELYPGLIPTSRSGDEGEDAHTNWSTLFLNDGKWISVSASKDGSETKLQGDCQTIKEKGHRVDILVFAVANDPQRDTTIKKWQDKVKREFGWELEVRSIRWLKSAASKPEYEGFVNDHLGVPPHDGDFIQTIQTEFTTKTDNAIAQIRFLIPGMTQPLQRTEIDQIEEILGNGQQVLLSGDAGTGKSVIARTLALRDGQQDKVVFLLDARRVAHVRSEAELRRELGLKGPVKNAVERIGKHKGLRFIVDQLDNTLEYASGNVLVDLIVDCCELEGVEIVVIARPRGSAREFLENLKRTRRVVSIESKPLDSDSVRTILDQDLSIQNPSQDLITLGKNLLNLSLIGRIKEQQPDFDFSAPLNEVDLWEKFVDVLEEHERTGSEPERAREIVAKAIALAQEGLRNPNRTFIIRYDDHDQAYERLVSWQIIVPVEENRRVFRFFHEQLQDFLYARNATQECLLPNNLLQEVDPHKLRNVLVWMDKLYTRGNSSQLQPFLEAVFRPNNDIPFYAQTAVLDRYIHASSPGANAIALPIIIGLLSQQSDLRGYFFQSKPHPGWVPVLWDYGFFNVPPPFQTNTGWWGPRWDVQTFLISVAEQVPDFIVRHFESIDLETWHGRFVSEAIEGLCNISAERVLPLVPGIIALLERSDLGLVVAPAVLHLITSLAQAGEQAAFEIFGAVIDPMPSPKTDTGLPIVSRYNREGVENESLIQVQQLLARLNVQRLVEILERCLLNALRLEAILGKNPNFEFVASWRPSIEDDELEREEESYSKYSEGQYRDRLLRILRDALKNLIAEDPIVVQPLIERYLQERYYILRRMGLFLLIDKSD